MVEAAHIDINHEVLIWARETIALNKTQAAERTGISLKRLTQLEEGDKQPNLEELKAFSKAYKRTIATLLLNKPPKEKPLPVDRRTVNSLQFGQFHEKTIMAVRKARAMANSFVDLRQEMGMPFQPLRFKASINDNPREIGDRLRQHLQLDEIRDIENTKLAFETYIERIESLGIAVFQLTLTQDNVRGFAVVDDVVPIIGIKRGSEQFESKIFTLFHELGHILLNEGSMSDLTLNPTWEIEKWCNAFAGELLVPLTELLTLDLVKQYKDQKQFKWSKKDLTTIAKHFHVGLLVILRRLLDNGLTTRDYYLENHEKWNKPQFGISKNPEGRNVPKETIQEKGKTNISLAFKAFDQNRITIKDLSDFLGIRLSYIAKTRQLLNA